MFSAFGEILTTYDSVGSEVKVNISRRKVTFAPRHENKQSKKRQ